MIQDSLTIRHTLTVCLYFLETVRFSIQKIKKSLAHRPLHPESEEYEKFKKKLSQQIEAITKKYPTIKLI